LRCRVLINADIGPSTNLNWVATVWTLGSAIGFLLVGRLSDIFGRKWMVMGTTMLGLIGCIIGCTAQSIDTLIGANLCNGLAAAGQLSFGIVLGELVPNKQRGPIITLVFVSSLPFAGKNKIHHVFVYFTDTRQSLDPSLLDRSSYTPKPVGGGATISESSYRPSAWRCISSSTTRRHMTSCTCTANRSGSNSRNSTSSVSYSSWPALSYS